MQTNVVTESRLVIAQANSGGKYGLQKCMKTFVGDVLYLDCESGFKSGTQNSVISLKPTRGSKSKPKVSPGSGESYRYELNLDYGRKT